MSGRDITAAMETASKAYKVNPFLLVELQVDSGTVYVSSLNRQITWNSNNWKGIGQLGALSAIEESMELQAVGARLSITGIPTEYVTMVLTEDYQNRPAIIRLGFMDESDVIIANPIIIFEGFIDQMSLRLGEFASIEVNCQNELADWNRPNVRRYTNADQQDKHPGDLFCEFVGQTVENEIVWGSGPSARTIYNSYGRSFWAQDFDAFGQPILPDWWNDVPVDAGADGGAGGGGDAGAGGGGF